MQIEFGVGEVKTKLKSEENNLINIGGAKVKPVRKMFKEKLMSMVDDDCINDFENTLEQYEQFTMYDFIGLTAIPLLAVINDDGTITEVEGLDENEDWEIEVKEAE